jgi:hypothetical protein
VKHAGPGRWRLGILAAAVTGVALLTAACGGSSTSSTSSQGPPTLQDLTAQALAYSKCMRSHGIPNFPDPTVQDSAQNKGVGFNLPATGSGAIDTSSPVYRSANKGCEKQTGFGHITKAQIQAAMNAMLKYAECMRSHGISNFPDPVDNGTNIGFNTTGIDSNSARAKAADKACRPLLPDGGP